MPRRSQSNVEFLLSQPWWISATLGVLAFLLLTALRYSLATLGGPMGKALAQVFGILPTAALVLLALLALASAIFRWKRGERLESQTSIESIRGLTWTAFEGLVSEAYRRRGFNVEQLLSGGADGGIDLILRKDGETTLVQCKQWRNAAVGVPIVREIFGVLVHESATRAVIITSGHFTREAEAFAAGKAMVLIEGEQLLEMVRDVQTKTPAAARAPSRPKTEVPSCPKCGSTMVRRTAKHGANAGNAFWGCSTYPRFSGTRAI
jgi:restriction system protein